MSDFFPLEEGAVLRYALETARGKGEVKVDILSVALSATGTIARCRRTVSGGGNPPGVVEFQVFKDAGAVRSDAFTEFVLPATVGSEWIVSPRRYWIEALDAEAETPAGTFEGCLRVAYLIAEGDGGSGERHYAPGVGLVKAVEHDEGEPYSLELVARRG